MKKIIAPALPIFCTSLVILLFNGCAKSAGQVDPNWTPPIAVSSSIGNLGGWIDLYKCQNTIIGIGVLRGGSPYGLILNPDHKSWSNLSFTGAPSGYVWSYSAIDPKSQAILSSEGFADTNQRVVMEALLASLGENHLKNIKETRMITEGKALLGETDESVKLNAGSGSREDIGLGVGLLDEQEAYIPFSIKAAKVTRQGKSITVDRTKGPFVDGVFHSSDAGKTWKIEKISDLDATGPDMSKTAGYVYYFAGTYPLWSSRKAVDTEKWDEPQTIAETFSMQGWFAAASDGRDTVHFCWMDRRHNKWRFNIDGPPIENDDIYYCHRKDSDSRWSKEILLSKGLEYCYPPSISSEGTNVVVVWAGVASADKHHSEYQPNDIYYVISKDSGLTWTKPIKITDKLKDGVVSGRPKVVLLDGIIHLFYTQGTPEKTQELSPGLTRSNDQPWPIYYTQRPFPN